MARANGRLDKTWTYISVCSLLNTYVSNSDCKCKGHTLTCYKATEADKGIVLPFFNLGA
jgi:hypothetical protein